MFSIISSYSMEDMTLGWQSNNKDKSCLYLYVCLCLIFLHASFLFLFLKYSQFKYLRTTPLLAPSFQLKCREFYLFHSWKTTTFRLIIFGKIIKSIFYTYHIINLLGFTLFMMLMCFSLRENSLLRPGIIWHFLFCLFGTFGGHVPLMIFPDCFFKGFTKWSPQSR